MAVCIADDIADQAMKHRCWLSIATALYHAQDIVSIYVTYLCMAARFPILYVSSILLVF